MTIALTGGTGFVGRAVLDEAARKGLATKALTRRDPPGVTGCEWVRGDLGDRTALAELADGAAAFLHIAGLTKARDDRAFAEINVLGTQTVLEAAKVAGVQRFVFVSSLSAREPDLSAYGRSKAEAEMLVEASGMDCVIVRPPAVFGPRDTEMLDLFRAAKRGVVPLPPPGRVSLIEVSDLAKLLLTLCQSDDVANEDVHDCATYEPDDGASAGYSHRELAGMIAASVGRDSVFAPHMPRRVLSLAGRMDVLLRRDKARLTRDRAAYMAHPDWVADPALRPPASLWEPQVTAREGLVDTARWYTREGWL